MENVVIIGSGPAGLTASIYCARAALNPLTIAGLEPGGQLTTTSTVENFPGFEDGIDGNQLMAAMRQQAENVGTRFRDGFVKGVEKSGSAFKVVFDNDESIETKSLIIGTGASAITLGLPSEKKLMGYGLSTCAVCDGFFYRNKTVAVVGGGDSAMEEALYLAKLASKVYLIHRREGFRASKVMVERAQNHEKIEMVLNCTVTDTIADDKGLTGIKVHNSQKNEDFNIELDGLFMAIGHKPNTGFVKGLVTMDDKGYIILPGKETVTNVPGIFAAGDVEDQIYRQAITSAGRGCQAALECEKFLEGH